VGVGNVIANGMRTWSGPIANLIGWKKAGCSPGCCSEDLGLDLLWCWFQRRKVMGEVGRPFLAGVPKSNGEPWVVVRGLDNWKVVKWQTNLQDVLQARNVRCQEIAITTDRVSAPLTLPNERWYWREW
jgi:hypothetical protein